MMKPFRKTSRWRVLLQVGWAMAIVHGLWFLWFLLEKIKEEDFIVQNLGTKIVLGLLLLFIISVLYFFILKKIQGLHKSMRFAGNFIVVLYLFSMLWLAWCTVFNPPITITHIMNAKYSLKRNYVSSSNLGVNIKLAAIAAEDQLFPDHDGFDLKAIKKAIKYNQRNPKKQRGASTISQQTAKNIFLWQGGGFLRKGLEVFYTFTIEKLWSKEKILTRYLNIAEMGPGIFGADAAARAYYNKPSKDLTYAEAASIAAAFPNPKIFTVRPASRFVVNRSPIIQRQMAALSHDADVMEIVK